MYTTRKGKAGIAWGIILMVLGIAGAVGSNILDNDTSYNMHRIESFFSTGRSVDTAQIILYCSIGVGILGIILLIAGIARYASSGTEAAAASNYATNPSVNRNANVPPMGYYRAPAPNRPVSAYHNNNYHANPQQVNATGSYRPNSYVPQPQRNYQPAVQPQAYTADSKSSTLNPVNVCMD